MGLLELENASALEKSPSFFSWAAPLFTNSCIIFNVEKNVSWVYFTPWQVQEGRILTPCPTNISKWSVLIMEKKEGGCIMP